MYIGGPQQHKARYTFEAFGSFQYTAVRIIRRIKIKHKHVFGVKFDRPEKSRDNAGHAPGPVCQYDND